MAKEPEDLVLRLLREMRGDKKSGFAGLQSEIARIDETLHDVRRHVVSLDLCVEALDEKVEMIREGTISASGYAANASRAHVNLQKQISDLAHRVERFEGAK